VPSGTSEVRILAGIVVWRRWYFDQVIQQIRTTGEIDARHVDGLRHVQGRIGPPGVARRRLESIGALEVSSEDRIHITFGGDLI
jgi:hypothetical protein